VVTIYWNNYGKTRNLRKYLTNAIRTFSTSRKLHASYLSIRKHLPTNGYFGGEFEPRQSSNDDESLRLREKQTHNQIVSEKRWSVVVNIACIYTVINRIGDHTSKICIQGQHR
jgi:hypothetical protein